ncbi:DUF962 domain-containing protein [Roseateles puraquae]|uniref:Mpo1 family 2-hydroxy fatty acid dioxygenase n=1 Tax=Roseateles puraquae TaxID=431059 RepID=UPI0031DDB2B1
MKTLEDQLANYAAYHRDSRNIATHFVGIPLIVVAVATLLSRPVMPLAGLPVSPAVAVSLLTALYYLRLDLRLGLLMTALLAGAVAFGAWAAGQTTALWLTLGVGGFAVGWVFQFVGHFWEGRKPAFVDDLIGLIIGPLFVTVELLFLLGLYGELQQRIDARVGSVRRGRTPASA